MRHTTSGVLAAAALALAGCSQMGAAGPGPERAFGPGYGRGPGYGMMAGMRGPGMMGPGMIGGWHGLPSNLTAEQRSRIAEIQREQRSRQWPLMQQMHELAWAAAADPGPVDEQAQRRDYERMAGLQKQLFENMLESRQRIEAVLTPRQREQLRGNWRAQR